MKPPAAPALFTETGECVTYGELVEHVKLLEKHITGRCLIFCMCRNEPGAVAGYLAFVSGVAVPLLLDAAIADEALDKLCSAYRPSYFWAPEDTAERFKDSKKVFTMMGYALLKTKYDTYPMNKKLGLLLATSGSTGSPKLVRQSRANIEANAESIRQYLGLTAEERPITSLPMQYTYGLSIINSHLLAGACLLLTAKSVVQREFWDFFKERGATSFGGVPFTYELLKKIRFMQMDMPSLTCMTQAGGKLPITLQEEFGKWAEEHKVRFFVMYGQTEATARMSYLKAEKCLEKCGSIGVTIPGGEFWLRDADGSVIKESDKVGELIYMGQNVTLGYAECTSDLEKGDERGGVLETGDMAKRDADGYYYIVGRKKRFVKLLGIRVSLDECEQLLLNRFEGVDFACVGEDDHLLIYAAGGEPDAGAEYLSDILRINRSVFEERLIDAIPKSDFGKTLYIKLQEEGK